jgi:hypothetical protein
MFVLTMQKVLCRTAGVSVILVLANKDILVKPAVWLVTGTVLVKLEIKLQQAS